MNDFAEYSITDELNFEDIHRVIAHFYDKARSSDKIGQFFKHIDDFSRHEKHIAAFWWFALGGNSDKLPMTAPGFDMINKHLALGVKDKDLNEWLRLFKQTLEEELSEQQAKIWTEKLTEIARQLKRMVIDQQSMGIQIKEPSQSG